VLKWAPYPFLRIVFFFSAGILTYLRVDRLPAYILPSFAALLLSYLIIWFLARFKKSADLHNLAGIVALLAIFLAGFVQTHFRTAKSQPNNISHYPESVAYYTGVVNDYIIHKPNSVSTTLALTKIKINDKWQWVSGNVRLSFKNEGKAKVLKYGTVLVIKGAPQFVKAPLNPGQFNYQEYLAHQQIYHQHYLNAGQFLVAGHQPPNWLIYYSIRLRDFLDATLRQNIPSAREYGIATALVLGIKDYLPEDIKTTYANTGTMHVLAVSGLHVALLFWVLNFVIGRWSERQGYKVLSFILLLSFIWLYGFVTALSASVLRAVVMFSFISGAKILRKQTNMYNTLAAAAFFLLLQNPYFLLDVGFQLSFLAVVGIVYFQPKIYAWFEVNAWLPDQIWALLSTSLAAQLAVLPLSFYYFHQFPVYFLLANIAAVFLSNVALILGFLLLGFYWFPLVAALLGKLLAGILMLMNLISGFLVKLPLAVISGIVISQTQAWCLYGMLFLVCVFLVKKQLWYFAVFTTLVLFFSVQQLAAAKSRLQQRYFVVYHTPQSTALGFVSGTQATVLADSAFYAYPKNLQYNLQPHLWQMGVSQPQLLRLATTSANKVLAVAVLPDGNELINWQGLKILYCRKPLRGYAVASLKLDYMVLSNNAYVSPDLNFNTNSKLVVVVTGANYKSYVRKIKARFRAETAVKLYVTEENGALQVALPK